jgi:hypothetical protein
MERAQMQDESIKTLSTEQASSSFEEVLEHLRHPGLQGTIRPRLLFGRSGRRRSRIEMYLTGQSEVSRENQDRLSQPDKDNPSPASHLPSTTKAIE